MSRKWNPLGIFARRVLAFAFFFAILFGAIALAEHQLVTWQDYETEADDLHNTVDDVSDNLFRNGHWDLAFYRQWDNTSEDSSYLVVSATGELVDLWDPHDFGTALMTSAIPVDKYIPRRPSYVTTDFGERWLIQNKPVEGGNVIGGIVADDLVGLRDPETLVTRELAKYGRTITSAENLSGAAIRNYMSGVMLVRDSGQIVSGTAGVVPLRVQLQVSNNVLDGRVHNFQMGDNNYNLLSLRTAKPAARIIAFDVLDTTVADKNLKYNLLLALGAWLFSLSGYAVFAIRDKRRQNKLDKSLEISTRQLIAQGERAPVEFKETLRRNLFTGKDDVRIEQAVLKTIAAFLNTEGGTLLIGVSDDRKIVGLAADEFSNSDKAMLHLTNLIKARIGSRLAVNVNMRVETMDNGLDVLRVDCKRSAIPAYVKGDGKEQHFYVRTGPATEELPLSEAHDYIRTRFETVG